MAEIISHTFLAKDVSKKLRIRNKGIIYFSLGPDPFYFSSKTFKYGNTMHRKRSLDFFTNYVKYMMDNDLCDNDDVKGCLYGFISHYVFDMYLHPYVFYKTGVFNKKRKETYKYLDGHRKMEMGITSYLASKNKIDISKYKFYDEIFPKKRSKEIIKILDNVFYKTFYFKNGGNIYFDSLDRCKKVYKSFRYDSKGFKKVVYSVIDLFRVNKFKLKYISFYNIKETDLNKDNLKWYNPCNKKVSNDSVDDIYQKSIDKTIELICIVNDIFKGVRDIKCMKKYFGNNSYLSGIDIEGDNKFRYFED